VPTDDEVVIRLNTPADLFRTADGDSFLETGRLESGMEELLRELGPRRLGRETQVVIVLPAEQVQPTTGDHVRRAVQLYCRLRIRRTELELRSLRREGIAALGAGGLLFLIGLGLSSYFDQPSQPAPLQDLLGNGVFLVIAWVGLWYPLDTLVFARRPMFRERRVLSAILGMELTVGEDDGTWRRT
jgi:hypothetical protein